MAGYWLAQFTFEGLRGQIDSALADLAAGTRFASAGRDDFPQHSPDGRIVSALSRGVGQSALAHELYYQLRTLFPAGNHGRAARSDRRGWAFCRQLYYNGEAAQVEPFARLLRAMGAPTCLSENGFSLQSGPLRAHCIKSWKAGNPRGRDAAAKRRFAEAMAQIAR